LKGDIPDEKNEFEKDMEDLQDWLDNQYNPGHYVGTGRVSRPISRLSKYPILLIAFGLLNIIPVIKALVSSKFTWPSLISIIIPLTISTAFIIGGIKRYAKMRNKKSKEHRRE